MGKKLHVGNIPSGSTEEDISSLFGRYGYVEFVEVIRDPRTGLSKGFAQVEMSTDAEAQHAISRLNFTQYDGLVMGVREARSNPRRIR
jgi:RNA recognition motif-containing protein